MSAVSVSGLSKSFGPLRVLKDIDLPIDAGDFTVLLGPSGCGKTTLLNAIAGLEDTDSGIIEIDGAIRLAGFSLANTGSRRGLFHRWRAVSADAFVWRCWRIISHCSIQPARRAFNTFARSLWPGTSRQTAHPAAWPACPHR